MEKIIQIVFFGIIGCLIICTARKYFSEYVLPISITVGIIIVISAFGEMEEIKEFVSSLTEYGLEAKWLKSTVKITLVCFIGQWGSGICADIGEKSVSDKIETAVKITVVALCLPYIKELFQFVSVLE